MKKRIFIGGSSEELGIANKVKKMLEKDFEVTVWNNKVFGKEIFALNNNFLSDLLKAPLKFDFGILIGTPDDQSVIRGNAVFTARDNILFELGLFVGKLGIDRCAFLVDERVEIPSDYAGINISKFNENSLANEVRRIKQVFLGSNNSDVNFFPSSTLAFGYFENFIRPICKEYYNHNSFKVDEKEYFDVKFRIVIPDKLSEDINQHYQKIKNKIGVVERQITSVNRTRSYNIDLKSFENGSLEILDFPTTLTGINYAIRELLPDEYKSFQQEYKMILDRELNKFIATLEELIKKYDYNDFIKIEKW